MVCMPYKDYGLVGDMTSVRPVYTVPSGANGDNLRGPWSYTGLDSLQGADLSEQEQEQMRLFDGIRAVCRYVQCLR